MINFEFASQLGLLSKIDTTNDDPEYAEKWNRTLSRFAACLERSRCAPVLSLDTVDAHSFFNLDLMRQEINENYDFVQTEAARDTQKSDSCVDPESVEIERSSRYEGHVVDVEWENGPRGARIFMYTRDLGGNSATFVVPFQDYFYIQLSGAGCDLDCETVKKNVRNYAGYLKNTRYPENRAKSGAGDGDTRRSTFSIPPGVELLGEMVVVDGLKTVLGYQPNASTFLKVTTKFPQVTVDLFRGLSKKNPSMLFFESAIDPIIKFLTKHNLSSFAGLVVEGVVWEQHNPLTTCSSLAFVTDSQLSNPFGAFREFVPKYMFWDIECLALDIDVFPTSDICPVIQISYLLSHGDREMKRGVLCLHDTPGEFFESFESEDMMLIRFAQIVREFNPEALVGYNSNNFDMPYLLDRMKVLRVHGWASQFSRRLGLSLEYARQVVCSKQSGARDVTRYESPGLLMFDQFELLKNDTTKKLDSYSLKNVCAEYLKDNNKEELRYRDIPTLFETPEGRAKIASYCLKDGELLLSLEKAVMFGVNMRAMAQVLGTTGNVVCVRGVTYKLSGKLKQYTERYGFLIPSFSFTQRPVFDGDLKGACVLDPDVGFHEDPVAVLDYASLYPSIMIYYNLSYDTLVLDKDWALANQDKCDVMENGEIFVKRGVQRGILALLERELGEQRTLAKGKMAAAAKGSVEAAIFNGMQNAMKIVMNSLYGSLGSAFAAVPCIQIAATITAMGRYNLLRARDYVHSNYCRLTAQPAHLNAVVVYGDTDSIFIKMPGVSVAGAIEYGRLLEAHITTDLYCNEDALVMEYEKVLCPLLLCTRKRYAGRLFKKDPEKSELAYCGLQVVKRDSPELLRRAMKDFFEALIMRCDAESAAASVEAITAELFRDTLPLSYFKVTKKVSKRLSDYKKIPSHIHGWQRLVQRVGKSEAPCVGEMFDYVVTRIAKGQKGLVSSIVDYRLAEEKELVRELDKDYYHEAFLSKPMKVPLDLVVGTRRSLKIRNRDSYTRVETVQSKPGNILAAFGIKSTSSTKTKRVIDFVKKKT